MNHKNRKTQPSNSSEKKNSVRSNVNQDNILSQFKKNQNDLKEIMNEYKLSFAQKESSDTKLWEESKEEEDGRQKISEFELRQKIRGQKILIDQKNGQIVNLKQDLNFF